MNPISFMTANYYAREVGFRKAEWGVAQNAAMDFFRPVETYAERFGAMLDTICGIGFTAIDLWLPHLHPDWATPKHIDLANSELQKRGLKVVSLAGFFGRTPAELEQFCKLANAVGTRVLGGMASMCELDAKPEDRAAMVDLLEKYDVLMAIENHPEKTPSEVLAKIGDGGRGYIGTTVDTGIWYGKGYDAEKAITELEPYIFHVHLKDAPALGVGESCRYDQGVPLKGCVDLLLKQGYQGAFSVEHEPYGWDPTEDVAASLVILKGWLK